MKFFCKDEMLNPMIGLAAFDAGYLIAKNEGDLAQRSIAVVDAMLALINKGGDAGSINAAFKEAVTELVNTQIKDPLVKMNVLAVLQMVDFTIESPVTLEIPKIKGLITNYKAGIEAYKK
jgi:hypothetical protein